MRSRRRKDRSLRRRSRGPTLITIIDYDRGNLFSMGQALNALGHKFRISQDPEDVAQSDTVVLPGVGALARQWIGLMKPV